MYLERTRTFYDNGGQKTLRAPFLLLLQPKRETIGESCSAANTYGVVRRVALSQFGHFMMGRANLSGRWVTVSGSYGGDGLPLTVDALPRDAKPLPPDLFAAWSKGGGHNGAGNEAELMRDWARANFKF